MSDPTRAPRSTDATRRSISANTSAAFHDETTWQDALAVEIWRFAHRVAKDRRLRNADDIAQDVVLHCLKKLRSGQMAERPMYQQSLVIAMVKQRAIDYARQRKAQRRLADALNARVPDDTPEWMQPGLQLEIEEMEALQRESVEALPPKTRRVFVMVRQENKTYKAIGAEMGITPKAVSGHVVEAQRTLRANFAAKGIATRPKGARRKARGLAS